jgi:phosphoglycolate phosphatase
MELPVRLIIFDFDGTLADSQAGIVRCMAQAFSAAALPVPPAEAVRRVVGLSLELAIGRLLPAGAEDRLDELCDAYRRAFFALRSRDDFEEPLFPGARAALERLNRPELLLGIATGKNSRGLRAALDSHDLAQFFVTLQTADTAASKPHPEMLQRAMTATGCEAEETVLIGDTSYDMQMARNAGVWAVGVAWGYHPREELLSTGAHRIVERFAELDASLTGLAHDRLKRGHVNDPD